MSAIQFGHLNGLQYVISPVQVATHPVDSKTLSDGDAAVKYLSGKKGFFNEREFHSLFTNSHTKKLKNTCLL